MRVPLGLLCLDHGLPLTGDSPEVNVADMSALSCDRGCRVPVIHGIPRFVDLANYADAFGLQWNAFSKTQLDSHTGLTLSRDRLAGALGGSLDNLQDKNVLEVGCGAGRFTEVMLVADARVFACDLSTAVEANYENCHRWPNYFVCQADARAVPVVPHSFDFVICLGVIQHTPSPEETIAALTRYLKPGGALIIDHYARTYPANFSRRWVRGLLLLLPPATASFLSLNLARAMLPVHRLGWNNKRGRWRLRRRLRMFSPLVDYYDVYPELGEKLLGEWALLDTHDTLTDFYKHLRSVEEIQSSLASCGLIDIEAYYGGNGIEARARMPALIKKTADRS